MAKLRVSLQTPLAGWDLFFTAALAALLCFMPAAFGSVEAWAELIVVAAVALLTLGVAVRTVQDPLQRPPWTWAYVPLLAIVGLATLQLVPLPAGITAALAPYNAALRTEFLGPELAGDGFSISLAPQATTHDLRLTLAACGLFLVGVSAFRTREQILRLLTVIVAAGAAEALLAVLQVVSLTPNIYWTVPGIQGAVQHSGSFINYSHFAQFMNLSLGAGVALLLVRLNHDAHETAGSRDIAGAEMSAWKKHAYLIEALGVMALSVLLCRSRNGAMSLAVAAAVVGGLLWRKGTLSTRGWAVATVPLVALGLLFLLGFDQFYARMASLQGGEALAFRQEMTRATLAAWQAFPMIGSGLGTHQYVFPLFDTAITSAVAEHADNDWAQLLEEFGTIGFGAVMAFVGVVAATAWRLMRRGKSSLAMAAFGLTLGFVATAMHSLSDFGQRTPAVFALTLLTSAAIVNVGRLEEAALAKRRIRRHRGRSRDVVADEHVAEEISVATRAGREDASARTTRATELADDGGGDADDEASDDAADDASAERDDSWSEEIEPPRAVPPAPRTIPAARQAWAESAEDANLAAHAEEVRSQRHGSRRRSRSRNRSHSAQDGAQRRRASSRHSSSGQLVSPTQQRAVRAAAVVGALALAALWTWTLAGAANAYRAENFANASLALEDDLRPRGPLSDDDYADLLWTAERAWEHEPSHPRYAYRLNALRWEAMTRERNPETGSVMLDAEALPLVARIADELRATRTLAPTFGPPHALEGVLRLWTLDQPQGAALIENGYRLAPYEARACLALGELRARQGQADEAFAALRRAVQLESGTLAQATEMCLTLLDRPDFAEELAIGDHQRLNWLAAQYAAVPRYAARVEKVRALAEQTLREAAASDGATAGEVAAVAALDAQAGALDEAVYGYRRALGRDYAQIGWRLRLAQLLVELERYDEAVREARICLRLKPGLKGAEDIVGEHGR